MSWYETSAKTRKNIDIIFEDLAEKISDSINNNTKRKNSPSFLKKYSYKNITKKLEDIYLGNW